MMSVLKKNRGRKLVTQMGDEKKNARGNCRI